MQVFRRGDNLAVTLPKTLVDRLAEEPAVIGSLSKMIALTAFVAMESPGLDVTPRLRNISPAVPPTEGRIASRHGRGVGCGGRGSAGVGGDRRAGFSCERNGLRADERRFNALAKHSVGSTWPAEEVVRVAADGKTVWSWHPLLVSSRRRRGQPNRV
jgi:hypothetical protein